MKKIIQITPFFHPVTGGVEQHVLNLSRELKKLGYEVEIICSDSMKGRDALQCVSIGDEINNIKITHCKTWFSISHFYKFFPSVFTKLLKKNFDVAHVHIFRHPHTWLGLLAAKLKGKTCVLTSHGPFHIGTRSPLLQFFVNLHDWTFGILFTRLFDHIICVNSEEVQYFEKLGVNKHKITLIPNGITKEDLEKGSESKFREQFNIPKNKSIVLSVGRIHRTKNYEILEKSIEAMPDIKFVFIGPDDGNTEALDNRFDSDNVLFTGKLPHKDLLDAYAAADVFVLPSLYESGGVVLLEAMAQGCPVLATNRGGPKDIVKEDFGLLIDPKDYEAWVKGIARMLNLSEEERGEMGRRAKVEVKKYLWAELACKVTDCY